MCESMSKVCMAIKGNAANTRQMSYFADKLVVNFSSKIRNCRTSPLLPPPPRPNFEGEHFEKSYRHNSAKKHMFLNSYICMSYGAKLLAEFSILSASHVLLYLDIATCVRLL